MRLNEIGQALLPQAVELIERATAVERVLEGRAGYGKLRTGATLTIGNYWLARAPGRSAAKDLQTLGE